MLVHLETFWELRILMNWVFVLISAGAAACVLGFHCLKLPPSWHQLCLKTCCIDALILIFTRFLDNTIIISGENEDLQKLDNPSIETYLKDCRTLAQIQVIT